MKFIELTNIIFDFVLTYMKPIELFVFWYPITMGMLWVIGSVIYYYRIERKKPLPLTSTPFVSVLVPAYNEAENIANTVEKLNELNYPNYEIIIINDGSSDDSAGIEANLARQYERVRFVNLQENCGKANALYLGFLAAKGEFLVCVDGDSYLDKDCLNYMIPHFINPNNGERVGAVTGNPRVRNRSSLLSKIQLCEYASIISLIKRCQRVWGKVMTVSGVVVAFRKQALMDCGMWDRDMITEDIGVTWKLEKNFWDVRYEPNAICWMLVPETIKGLFKQRQRWSQGGQEVLFRHAGIFRSWRRRRLYPVYAEQIFSLIWVIAWMLLTVTELVHLCYSPDTYLPYFWKSQYISVICLTQFVVALILESKYDHGILKNVIVAAWYPAVYWIISGLVALTAIPKAIKTRHKKLATWNSPDRGIKVTPEEAPEGEGQQKGEDAQENMSATQGNHAPEDSKAAQGDQAQENMKTTQSDDASKDRNATNQSENVIEGKQKTWKKIIEVLLTIVMWVYILSYLGYCIYGAICMLIGQTPFSIWIYNESVILETRHLLYITAIIFLIEVVVMIFWKEYNRRKYGGLHRRTFKPDVSVAQMHDAFGVDIDLIKKMQTETTITLEHNLFSNDFKMKPYKKPIPKDSDEENTNSEKKRNANSGNKPEKKLNAYT